DIMTVAKALGCGVPIGAFLLNEKVSKNSLVAGDHGTTYGGNPLACAAANKVLEIFAQSNIIKNVNVVGDYLYEKLEGLKEKSDKIIAHRGLGLIQGLEFSVPVAPIINEALKKGLVLINAGTNILRFVPPLIVSKENVDEMIAILEDCIDKA
nr:aminotransferase class III-fold pyridoxal phosphate-dependent enzyme [Lachnospiraceae bacterium]